MQSFTSIVISHVEHLKTIPAPDASNVKSLKPHQCDWFACEVSQKHMSIVREFITNKTRLHMWSQVKSRSFYVSQTCNNTLWNTNSFIVRMIFFFVSFFLVGDFHWIWLSPVVFFCLFVFFRLSLFVNMWLWMHESCNMTQHIVNDEFQDNPHALGSMSQGCCNRLHLFVQVPESLRKLQQQTKAPASDRSQVCAAQCRLLNAHI